ncbi:hypothetical protein [Methanobrevibacter sp.]|uniref:hypothetical protein n=1 Tax=Methanobrevibacter sp. TaxID=66852 RepID=UPI00388FC5C6
MGDIIKRLYSVIAFSFILFLCAGIVSASENITDDGDIANLIDECEDNGVVKLDEKTYELNPKNETHLHLNKSVSIEGTSGKTVIDGKNSTLFLDVEKEPESDYNRTIIIPKDIYDIKNTGKHIIFKNITFKDLNLISRHKMDFLDCRFINTNFTSKELDNSFDNCIFNESKIVLNLYDVTNCNYYSKVTNCSFYSSKIISNVNIYVHIVGSSRVFVKNSLDLINSSIINSDLSLSYYSINISGSEFSNAKLNGHSDIVNINGTSFSNPEIDLGYTDISFEESVLNNSQLKFQAGYYAKGCNVVLNDSTVNNSTFGFYENIGSRPSNLIIQNSSIEKCEIKTTDTNIKANNSNFNKTIMELFFSNLNICNSVFYNEGNITDTIKTITEEPYHSLENGTVIEKYYPCFVNTSYTAENSYFINNSGKYEISGEDINVETIYIINFDETITYRLNDNITINVKDHKGNPISNMRLCVRNPDRGSTVWIFTDENGNANYTLDEIGELNLEIYYETARLNFMHTQTNLMQLNLTVHPIASDIKLIKDFKFNKYSKINSFLEVKTAGSRSGDLSDLAVTFKVFTGKSCKTYTEKTDSSGNVIFEIPTNLNAGVHKIQVIIGGEIMKTTSISIQKANTIVKAPKVVKKYKKSGYFKVSIKNKETKKMLSNVKVKIKVFTGKKFKTYAVKTNKKGIAKINTKKLKIGNHKVIISSGNKNYSISGKSLIKIKK